MFVPNFKILGGVVAEKCVTKYFIWEKEKKWTNKGYAKHVNAESLLHNTSSHTQCLHQILKS